ncbi:MAG: 2-amino-4-hydroxy-6-hydroxymethyldihydropteridine diphosphokinase [Actinobacteria bacterium]|nr:2-amino-4-hydroxy-6-hydroxymethyldihydropteridine diphosphokinase [Actinomycetota bacterium]
MSWWSADRATGRITQAASHGLHHGRVALMDKIEITGLRVMTLVGVLAHERESAQPLEFDITLEGDLRDAGASDDLADTAHYGLVAERAAAIARESKDELLERLVHRIAEDALTFDRVEAVEVVVRKLRPPIPEDLQHTSVRIRRTRADLQIPPRTSHRAIVALGTNLGDRVAYLKLAVDELGTGIIGQSQVFETAPVGGPDNQGAYLNMVVAVETSLDPFAMLRRCQRIESLALRQRVIHWGPRTLDVDLLFYDGVTIDSPELTIPHPRYAERRFVLAPLSEVAPELCPKGWDATVAPDDIMPLGPLADLY